MAEEVQHPDGARAFEAERPIVGYPEAVLAAGVGGFPALRRVSWGGIFAGTVVALVVSLLLSLLGIAIGASTVDPMSERDPTAGLGVGSGIWWIASSMIGLFAGGWVAARLAGNPRRFDAILHGIVTWGLATIVTFMLVTTALGRIIGGAASLVGQGIQAVGQEGLVSPGALTDIVTQRQQEQQQAAEQIRGEAQNLLAQQGAQAAQADLNQAMGALLDGQATAQDRNTVINILVSQGGLERAAAEAQVNEWVARYQQATDRLAEMQAQLPSPREATETIASGIARGALWTFFGLLLTGAAAALGGWLGRPRDIVSARSRSSTRAPPVH